MKASELLYYLALQRVPNLGDRSAKKLIHAVGSAEAVFKEKKAHLLKIDGIGDFKLNGLFSKNHLESAEIEINFMTSHNVSYAGFLEPHYPERLKHCPDGPIMVFYSGNINLNNRKVISVVGTRKASSYGISACEKIIEDLAPLNPIIVSGFAYGIDITAHKAAIKNKLQTIACLAHGLNQIYPKVHSKYKTQIEQNGGFITDFGSTVPFEKNNFLKRNRIIAGLSEATIIIESAEKGGSLVTADIANSYNREVFALPGRNSDRQSIGCNNLIKSQQAHLITHAADIIYILNWELGDNLPKPIQKQLFVELNEEEKIIFRFLKNNPKTVLDLIALGCEMPTFKVASLLLNMELKGVVKPLPGKLFELT